MVVKQEGETIKSLLARHKADIKKSGILEEMQKRRFFMTTREKRAFKRKYRQVFGETRER